MKGKRKKSSGSFEVWQPTSDLMTALVLLLLMIIVLLLLYLVQYPENQEIDPYLGDEHTQYHEIDAQEGNRYSDFTSNNRDNAYGDTFWRPDYDSGGGGGGHDFIIPHETNDEYKYDENGKAAVYVKVVDGETGSLIREKGITFELYENNRTLKVLHNYYPEYVSYQKFSTTDDGIFYLPEKIDRGEYYFQDLTTVDGYVLASNQYFNVDDDYDWPDPYVVTISLYPYKNIIRVQMLDAASGIAIEGGTFEVVAAEDIVTKDGTIRYHKGDVVDEIICDREGNGSSIELYLGRYSVRQKIIPEFYASVEESPFVSLTQEGNTMPDVLSISSTRTKIGLRLTDELETRLPIQGVEFIVTNDSDPDYQEVLTTDTSGRIQIDGIEKNTVYHFSQVGTTGNYRITEREYAIAVAGDGRVNGQAESLLAATNRLLRVSFGVKDVIFHRQMSGISMALFESDETPIKTWTSSEAEITLDSLKEADYYLIVGGENGRRYDFQVKNTAEIQNISVTMFTVQDYLLLGVAVFLGLILLVVIIAVINHNRKKKH